MSVGAANTAQLKREAAPVSLPWKRRRHEGATSDNPETQRLACHIGWNFDFNPEHSRADWVPAKAPAAALHLERLSVKLPNLLWNTAFDQHAPATTSQHIKQSLPCPTIGVQALSVKEGAAHYVSGSAADCMLQKVSGQP
jgi:hypothetical protein